MDPKELKEIDKFLTLTGAVDLFAYMGLPATADADMADLAMQDRREWAQTQQANPKYRTEALWIIRNSAIVRKALEPRLRQLEDFIQGVLSGGGLTPKATDAIRKKGQALGVPPETLTGRLEALLEARGREIAEQDEERTEDLAPPIVEVDDDPSSDSVSVTFENEDSFNEMPDFLAKDQSPEDELKDIVRGLRLQGMMQSSLEAMVFRRGKRMGLSDTVIRRIINEVAGERGGS
jgi:hypothetical protein